MRTMRVRLTVWHSAVVALLLALFAGAAYSFVARAIRDRDRRVLLQALDGLREEMRTEREEHPSDRQAAREVVRELRFRGFAFVIFDSTGAVIAASASRRSAGPGSDPTFDRARLGAEIARRPITAPVVIELGDREGGYQAAVAPVRLVESTQIASVVASRHEQEELLREAREAIAVALPVALLLSALGGWILARRSLAPMVHLRDRAARIGATSLGERLPIATPDDEVGRLATVINELLARLESAFAQQREFMADASHELRTPVAVVQNEASRVLARPGRTAAEYEDALRVIHEAARRLRRIVDDLFLLARADAGDVPLRPVPVYLDEVLGDSIRSLRSLAEARGVAIVLDAGATAAPMVGDEELLRRLVGNLLDNAIKYSPAGSTVRVRLERAGSEHRLLVADEGSGIPPEVQPRIFDRFVRADAARSAGAGSSTSGAGLGLAIARWVAEAHGGRLALVRSGAGGSVFALVLPAATDEAEEAVIQG